MWIVVVDSDWGFLEAYGPYLTQEIAQAVAIAVSKSVEQSDDINIYVDELKTEVPKDG
jgi:hypothetical protein